MLCLKWNPPPVQPSEGAAHVPQVRHMGSLSRGGHFLPKLFSGVRVTPPRLLLSAAEMHRERENFLSAGFPPRPLGEFRLASVPGTISSLPLFPHRGGMPGPGEAWLTGCKARQFSPTKRCTRLWGKGWREAAERLTEPEGSPAPGGQPPQPCARHQSSGPK